MTLSNIKNSEGFIHLLKTMKYSLYIATHPIDGFWDITHEKRGSVAAAHVFMASFLLTHLLKLQFTSFVFVGAPRETVNIVMSLAALIAPILLGIVANWGLTCLFDGKGKMIEIYMAVGYSMVP